MSQVVCPLCSDVLPCACPFPVSPDCRALRSAFGQFATGVTIVTTLTTSGKPVGLTVNSFASVSLEPPLVLWCLTNTASEFASFQQASHYCINVLAAEQRELSDRFASRIEDRFADVAWQPGAGGVPVLAGCCANFEVRNEIQYPGGDHHIFVGRVERFARAEDRSPLLFHAGRYILLGSDVGSD